MQPFDIVVKQSHFQVTVVLYLVKAPYKRMVSTCRMMVLIHAESRSGEDSFDTEESLHGLIMSELNMDFVVANNIWERLSSYELILVWSSGLNIFSIKTTIHFSLETGQLQIKPMFKYYYRIILREITVSKTPM